jgi:hypothetical protein
MIVSILLLAFASTLVAGDHSDHGLVSSSQQAKIKTLYNTIVNNTEYYAGVRPYGVNGTDSTFIYFSLYDVNILHVDESKGLFTFQGYTKKKWIDSRLAYNDTSVSYIPIKDCKSLWYPDLFFVNGVETSTFPVNVHTTPKTFRIYPNGKVFASYRITQTIHCPAFFKTGVKEVVCPVQIQSYGFFDDEITVQYPTTGEGVTAAKNVVLPKFTFGGVTAKPTCDTGVKLRSDIYPGHTHSCIQADFKFTRV